MYVGVLTSIYHLDVRAPVQYSQLTKYFEYLIFVKHCNYILIFCRRRLYVRIY